MFSLGILAIGGTISRQVTNAIAINNTDLSWYVKRLLGQSIHALIKGTLAHGTVGTGRLPSYVRFSSPVSVSSLSVSQQSSHCSAMSWGRPRRSLDRKISTWRIPEIPILLAKWAETRKERPSWETKHSCVRLNSATSGAMRVTWRPKDLDTTWKAAERFQSTAKVLGDEVYNTGTTYIRDIVTDIGVNVEIQDDKITYKTWKLAKIMLDQQTKRLYLYQHLPPFYRAQISINICSEASPPAYYPHRRSYP